MKKRVKEITCIEKVLGNLNDWFSCFSMKNLVLKFRSRNNQISQIKNITDIVSVTCSIRDSHRWIIVESSFEKINSPHSSQWTLLKNGSNALDAEANEKRGEGGLADFVVRSTDLYERYRGISGRCCILRSSTCYKRRHWLMMAWRRGRRGCRRARQRALEQKIHPSSRDLLHPLAHRLTYNLPAKHGFNLALSRYRSARTGRACQSMFTFFLYLCAGCQSTFFPHYLSLKTWNLHYFSKSILRLFRFPINVSIFLHEKAIKNRHSPFVVLKMTSIKIIFFKR